MRVQYWCPVRLVIYISGVSMGENIIKVGTIRLRSIAVVKIEMEN